MSHLNAYTPTMRPLSIGLIVLGVRAASAQVIDLTLNNVGIAIGDKPEMTGLRINYRDRHLREITGINATIWTPHDPASGTVNGIALGLPATGAGEINGLALAVLGA